MSFLNTYLLLFGLNSKNICVLCSFLWKNTAILKIVFLPIQVWNKPKGMPENIIVLKSTQKVNLHLYELM